jgi:hypothetical protein
MEVLQFHWFGFRRRWRHITHFACIQESIKVERIEQDLPPSPAEPVVHETAATAELVDQPNATPDIFGSFLWRQSHDASRGDRHPIRGATRIHAHGYLPSFPGATDFVGGGAFPCAPSFKLKSCLKLFQLKNRG